MFRLSIGSCMLRLRLSIGSCMLRLMLSIGPACSGSDSAPEEAGPSS